MKRAAVLRDPGSPAGIGQFAVIQTVASPLGVELTPLDVRDAAEIEQAIKSFARSSDGGLIVAASIIGSLHHELTDAGGPLSIARSLLGRRLRHRRRPDFLWT